MCTSPETLTVSSCWFRSSGEEFESAGSSYEAKPKAESPGWRVVYIRFFDVKAVTKFINVITNAAPLGPSHISMVLH